MSSAAALDREVDLAALSHEELRVLNVDTVARLNAAKRELAGVRARSARGEAWMPAAEFCALRERVTALTAEAQRVQAAIAIRKARLGPTYEREFITAARRFLSSDTFRLIDAEAHRAVDLAAAAVRAA